MVRSQLQPTYLSLPESPGYDRLIRVGSLQPSYRYSKVYCLLLKWENHDIEGLDEEVHKLKCFFQELAWTVKEYDIPGEDPKGSQDAEALLNHLILSFAETEGQDPQALLVIYYAGHGLNNKKAFPLWSPRRKSRVYLNWANPQKNIYAARADVLLLLDCCHAAMAAHRGAPDQSIQLLAASAMNAFAPTAGPYSFTTNFMAVLRTALLRDGSVSVGILHARLAGARLQATPFVVDLAQSNNPSIVLHPLPGSTLINHEPHVHAHTELILAVSIRYPLVGKKIGFEVAEWIERSRGNAPKGVGSVRILSEKKLPRAQWKFAVRGIMTMNRMKTRSNRQHRIFHFGRIPYNAHQLLVIPVQTVRYPNFFYLGLFVLYAVCSYPVYENAVMMPLYSYIKSNFGSWLEGFYSRVGLIASTLGIALVYEIISLFFT